MQAILSHYRIVEEIGSGGMSVVYRAHDERLDRDVAIKVLPSGSLADEAERSRFRKEALALSKLSHPNVATVFDFDSEDGSDFLVEELIPGESLDEMLAAGPLSQKEVVHLGTQLCAGLSAAHDEGIIHRDLKPANIRVTPDTRVKILDFGLAKVLHTVADTDIEMTASMTETQQVSGTLPYMAPEQLLNQELDARTDIWAAGCVLYEMATGRRPFPDSGPALINNILNHPPTKPSKLTPRLSAGLESVILKCLVKDSSLRYQSTREIARDLHRLLLPSSMVPMAVPIPRARRFLIGTAVVALAGLVAVAALWLSRHAGKVSQLPKVTPSVAVLPFVDISPEKNQEYFSDGLAEELLNYLTKIESLRVVGRTSSFQFKGKNEDLRVIGQKLNVTTILEGSVRRQGTHVRVTAQLISTKDGFHLWSETYDRQLGDVFAIEDEIALAVARALKMTLLVHPAPSTKNSEAYNAYLQGKYFADQRSKENMQKAIGYYQQAIRLDPGYAMAWVGLADALTKQTDSGHVPAEQGYRKAREAVERALGLDANLAEAYAVLSWIKIVYEWDWVGADASLQRVLALQPGNAMGVRRAAVLALFMGRSEEALALGRRAVELDPLNVAAYNSLGIQAYSTGRLGEAVASLKRALDFNPGYPETHSLLGLAYLAQSHPQEAHAEMESEPEELWRLQGLALTFYAMGRKKEADAALADFIVKHQGDSAYQISEVYAFRGEVDRAFEWLERARTQHEPGIVQLKCDPLLKKLHTDPRYAAFLKKMQLPA